MATTTATKPPKMTIKPYCCRKCGHETEQKTNHYGSTYNWGRYNSCAACPPIDKFPLSSTVWDCMESPNEETTDS